MIGAHICRRHANRERVNHRVLRISASELRCRETSGGCRAMLYMCDKLIYMLPSYNNNRGDHRDDAFCPGGVCAHRGRSRRPDHRRPGARSIARHATAHPAIRTRAGRGRALGGVGVPSPIEFGRAGRKCERESGDRRPWYSRTGRQEAQSDRRATRECPPTAKEATRKA